MQKEQVLFWKLLKRNKITSLTSRLSIKSKLQTMLNISEALKQTIKHII
jgi:hypothetical protein